MKQPILVGTLGFYDQLLAAGYHCIRGRLLPTVGQDLAVGDLPVELLQAARAIVG